MTSIDIPTTSIPAAVHGRSLWDDALRRLMRNRAAVTGMVMLAGLVLAAVIGPWLVPYTYDALNKGIELATGEVIGLVHSDDWLAHDGVIAQVAAAFRGGAHAVYGDLHYVSALDPGKVVRHWKAGLFRRTALRWGWMPPHPTLFVRRTDLIAAGGYDIHYRISADYDLVLKMFTRPGFCATYIPDVLVKMRLGGVSNGSLRQVLRKSSEDYLILRAHGVGGWLSLVAKNIRKLSQFRGRP